MKEKLLFITDTYKELNLKKDTSILMIEEALRNNFLVYQCELNDLFVDQELVCAQARKIIAAGATQVEGISKKDISIKDFKYTFMRKDPPVNIRYLYATYILDLINPINTLVLNSPRGLREANEKIYALQFHQFMPPTIVGKDKEIIHDFVHTYKTAVLKPLGGKAGEGILILNLQDPNLNSIIEISTHQGQEPVMIQQFLPEAKYGDKRIILLNGNPIGAVNRVPTGQEFRGNMAVGGRVEKAEISLQEHDMCKVLGKKLRQDGLYFVGIDIIGGYLTEINVTSPTGIREIDSLDQKNLGQEVIKWVTSQ